MVKRYITKLPDGRKKQYATLLGKRILLTNGKIVEESLLTKTYRSYFIPENFVEEEPPADNVVNGGGAGGVVGPKGEKGERGPKGEKGDKGDPGDIPSLKTINGQSLIGDGNLTISSGGGKKTISKYIVIGISGQSNSVGYDESPLTPYDVPADPDRIFQYSDRLKPLSYCAECFQDMNKVTKRNGSENMIAERANEFGHTSDRNTYVKTKGIHLPLANLILNSIPDDYGVIIVPGSYGGKRLSEFMPGKAYYINFINRLKGALDFPGSIFAGIIWSQGEHDALNSMSGTDYLNNLRTMINGINTALAGYANKSVKGSISDKDWYFFDWPRYFKDLDRGNILVELKRYFGNRYVEIPIDTPVNTATYTSSIREAHYGQNSFRTIIAPRVFKAMSEGNCFLVTDFDLRGSDTSSLETELAETKASNATLSSKVAELVIKVNELLQNAGQSTIETIKSWKSAVTTGWTNVFGGSSVASNDIIQFNNQKSAFLVPENVTGIKFKLRAPNNPGQYVLWLICSVNSSDNTNVRALTVDFQTNTAQTYTSWIKAKEGYNRYDGTHGSTAQNIKDVFNVHNVEITVLIEDGKIKCSNTNGASFEINTYSGGGFVTRLGLGSLNGFSNNIEAYDIQVFN